MKKIFKFNRISLSLSLGLLGLSPLAQAHVEVSDPSADGINYHLSYMFHHDGTLTAQSGVPLPNNHGTPGTVKSGAWSNQTVKDPSHPGYNTQPAGWGHASKWAFVDFGDINGANASSPSYKITVTLEDADASPGTFVPGFTIWEGADHDDGHSHWYPNGTETPPIAAGTWWAEDLTANIGHASGNAAGDVATFTTVVNASALADSWTIAFGGNDTVSAPHNDNFKLSVSVQAVPIPGAVWLFGSAIGIGLLVSRRRRQQWMPFAA